MPRKRKRDWPIKVYKFWAEPAVELPQAFWDHARSMRWLWNELVALHLKAREESRAFGEEEKERRREVWARFEVASRSLAGSAEATASLGWEAREWLLDRFRTAARQAARTGGELRPKRRLERVIVPHRFTGGGLDAEKLWIRRSKHFEIEPVDPQAYADERHQSRRRRMTRGAYGVGPARFTFRTILHRPFPPGSVVKQIAWSGERHPTRGWRWSLLVWVESPPAAATERRQTGRAAALDLGWRKMDGYLRVGVLYDNAGNLIELRLPLADTGNTATRRDDLPDSFADIQEMATRVGELVEEAKAAVRELLPDELPEEARGLVSRLVQVRQGGLVRLLRVLEAEEGESCARAAEALRIWAERNDFLRKRINDTRDRLLRRREWTYRNLALWLCATYDRVVWEGDLDLKQMAEHSRGDEALEAAAKYRAWASVHQLRTAIREASEKTGCVLTPGVTARTTTTCVECGETCEPTAKLVIACPRGHRRDQDAQAAQNLFGQFPLGEVPPRASAAGAVLVPEKLSASVVLMD